LLRLRENEIASVGIGRKFQKPTVFEKFYDLAAEGVRQRISI